MTMQQDSSEWRDELKATVRTRQELGEEMEEEVIESFLQRLQGSIDQHVDARVTEVLAQQRSRKSHHPPAWRIALVLGLSIPLVAVAGLSGGFFGILIVAAFALVLIFKS